MARDRTVLFACATQTNGKSRNKRIKMSSNFTKSKNNQDKIIICLDMDCYFVSVERILNPTLQSKPVIVGGNPKSRGVVSACSYEARVYGIHSGMALATAHKHCPHAIFIKSNPGAYTAYSKAIYQILTRYSPDVEYASIDEFYLDLTGCKRLYGNIFNTLWELKSNSK